MNTRRYFRFSIEMREIEKQRTDFTTIRREGDAMATEKQCPVRCECYNEPLQRWDVLGHFIGNRNFRLPDGEVRRISRDYTHMHKKGDES